MIHAEKGTMDSESPVKGEIVGQDTSGSSPSRSDTFNFSFAFSRWEKPFALCNAERKETAEDG